MECMLKKSDFPLICRTCLLSKSEMLSIKSLEVLKIVLVNCIGLKFEEKYNGLPNFICSDCKDHLEKFIHFKQQCEESETILLKILNEDEQIKCENEQIYDKSGKLDVDEQEVKDECIDKNNFTKDFFDDSNDRFSCQEEEEDDDDDKYFNNDRLKTNEQSILVEKDVKNEESDSQLTTDKENDGFITCKICDKKIRYITLKGHMRRHIQPKKHQCDQCSKAYREPNELAKHRAKFHKIKESVNCEVCNEEFQIQAQLDFHMKRHFKKKSVCNICGKEYFNSAKMQRHKQSHENREKTIFCLLCDRMFARGSSLIIHNKKYHSGQPLMKKICNICGKSVLNIKTHTLQKHTEERPFKCTQCTKSYVIKYQLLKHIKEQHEETEKKYNALCSTCGKCCKSIADLKIHMISHTNVQSFQCHICDNKYKSAQGLKSHISKHNNLRPYTCSHCPKAFYTSQILKNHLRTHTGERPYECQLCGRAFSQNCSLKTHMKIHGI